MAGSREDGTAGIKAGRDKGRAATAEAGVFAVKILAGALLFSKKEDLEKDGASVRSAFAASIFWVAGVAAGRVCVGVALDAIRFCGRDVTAVCAMIVAAICTRAIVAGRTVRLAV